MTGVSYTIPVVVAGGLAIALSFMFGIDAAKEPGSLAAALMQIGGQAAFALIAPVLSGFIAFSIADRPGLAPGLIGGMLANQIGAGFLGGLASGFLAGYIAYYLRSWIRLPQKLEWLKPVLIIPSVRQRRGRAADDLRGRNPDRRDPVGADRLAQRHDVRQCGTARPAAADHSLSGLAVAIPRVYQLLSSKSAHGEYHD